MLTRLSSVSGVMQWTLVTSTDGYDQGHGVAMATLHGQPVVIAVGYMEAGFYNAQTVAGGFFVGWYTLQGALVMFRSINSDGEPHGVAVNTVSNTVIVVGNAGYIDDHTNIGSQDIVVLMMPVGCDCPF